MVANCKDLRDAVALCLQRSECVLVQRNTPKACLEDPVLNKTLPQQCYVHFLRYLDCKRGQADRTKRFVGNGPKSTGKYEEDLEMMRRGDFNAEVELGKLDAGSEHVTSLQQIEDQKRDSLRAARRAETQQPSFWSKLKWW